MLRVLHIEDDPNMLEAVREALSCPDCGDIQVYSIGSLTEARAKLNGAAMMYDLLLVDLELPDSRGVDTVRALVGYNLPVMVLSGSSCPKVLNAVATAGAEDYLVKINATPERLIRRIRFVCQRWKAAIKATRRALAAMQIDPNAKSSKSNRRGEDSNTNSGVKEGVDALDMFAPLPARRTSANKTGQSLRRP